ncbi:MAG: radical SAM protein [Patescibacteria group bacterium]
MTRYESLGNHELIILLGYPCINKGRCNFCAYHLCNKTNAEEMIKTNSKVLSRVKGLDALEIYNSGSIFELPPYTLLQIQELVRLKNTPKIITEAHWQYRRQFKNMRKFLNAPEVLIKVGVETFNIEIREKIMKKGMGNAVPEEIKKFTSAINLLVGIKGQTQKTIECDIEISQKLFSHIDLSIFDKKHSPNPTIENRELIKWFLKNFQHLKQDKRFRILPNKIEPY